jgi:DNA end-binding protein Ku
MATSVWRGHISFGLVSIPVRLFRAARSERVKLREVYSVPQESEPELEPEQIEPPRSRKGPIPVEAPRPVVVEAPAPVSPVRRAAVDDEGMRIPEAQVAKAFEAGKGRFVTLNREELRALAPKTSTTMELIEFVNLSSVDPVYFETSYYVRPEEAGEKPYALLFASLKQTGLVGVAQIAMHRREHIVLVRSGKSGLIAHTMYFNTEVRADQEYRTDPELVNPKELELANKLVSALETEFNPEKFRDEYRARLEQLIEAKIAGAPVLPAAAPRTSKPAADIMDALRKSLDAVKKPPKPEVVKSKPATGRRSR